MKKMIALAALAGLATSAAANHIVKPPDLGPFWHPIDGGTGTYVYASDFVLGGSDTKVDTLGMWLLSQTGTTQSIRFEIWGDTGGNGPDPSSVLAGTGSINPAVGGTLDYHEAPASFSANLVPGNRYWFAATWSARAAAQPTRPAATPRTASTTTTAPSGTRTTPPG